MIIYVVDIDCCVKHHYQTQWWPIVEQEHPWIIIRTRNPFSKDVGGVQRSTVPDKNGKSSSNPCVMSIYQVDC